MKTKIVQSLLLIVAVGLPGALAICADADRGTEGLPRFHEVAPGIYRGGQPKPEGFTQLRQRGIKTIINLRDEHDEKQQVETLGFKYVYFPMDARDEIPATTIEAFLSIVADPAHQPVFIHCHRGADRTGFMVGLYRIAKQGWSADRAYSEARDIGMRWWYRGLKRQLFDYAGKGDATSVVSSGK